jgi:hypothetical protein
MKARAAIAVCLGALALTVLPASAAARTVTRTEGAVTATLSWKGNFAETRKFRLAIQRSGTLAFEGKVVAEACDPGKVRIACPWPAGKRPLDVAELDVDAEPEDAEPEVVVGGFTGGAHCCVVAIVYRWNGSVYETAEHNFLDAGYDLEDLDGNGVAEFVSRDARFAFLYGSFAESVFPIQMYAFNNAFIDITTGFPDEVKADMRALRKEYERRADTRRRLGVRSALAAYVADLYSLDRDRKVNRVLKTALRRGLLDRQTRFDAGPFRKRFISDLKRTLDRFGYR